MKQTGKLSLALHALGHMALDPDRPRTSEDLAMMHGTHPVVVRRVTSQLARAGLIGTRAGATGGAWLLAPPEAITLDRVLRAVGGCAHFGCPPPGAKGCPVGERIPQAVGRAIAAADAAAAARLSAITVADLLDPDQGAHAA